MKRRTAFSLAELVVATTIVAVVASVAIPAAQSRRLLANEACAVVALRDIASAQAKFQAGKFVDVNQDGVGEYALLRELSGAIGVRTTVDGSTSGLTVDPPLLARAFSRSNRSSDVARAGYLFHVVLPGTAGDAVAERSIGQLSTVIDSNLAATTWGCYAWPQRYGTTGNQTFFENQTDDIVATESPSYSGEDGPLRWLSRQYRFPTNSGAAFAAGGPLNNITGQLAIGTVGRDGNVWRLVTPRAEEPNVVSRGTLVGGYRRPRGSFTIESRLSATSERETLLILASGLWPGDRHDVVVGPYHFGRVVADDNGHASFRFDSRVDVYPAGLSSVLDLAGERINLDTPSYFAPHAYGVIPEFVNPHASATPPARVDSNEAAAIAGLRAIAAAQAQFRASFQCDVDVDGVAEFGLLRELTGATGVRNVADASTQGGIISPPLLPSDFRASNRFGDVPREGYLFHMVLPAEGGIGVMEVPGTAALAAPLNQDLTETTWCCYAWPQRYGKTGTRAFFINQSGDITATDVAYYSGTQAFVAYSAGSAFASGGTLTNITGQVATGTRGRDGNIWRLVPSRPDEHDFVVRGTMTAPASAATGTFVVHSRQLTNDTKDTIEVTADGLDAGTTYRVVVTDATGTTSFQVGGGNWRDARGRLRFPIGPAYAAETVPVGVGTVTAFGGGAIDVMSGDTVVLRGTLPVFSTIGGPHVPGSSVAFHVAKPLDPAPNQLPRHGSLDVRVTNAPEVTREELTVDVTTYDRDADPYGVFVVDALGVATPLGTIAVRGLRGTGTLSLDTARGDVIAGGGLVALSGERIEVRTPTGFVVLTATLPVVD